MPSFRLDDHASVYAAPAAIAGDTTPKGYVFRSFESLPEAKSYADTVCEFFSDSGAPAPVYVVIAASSSTTPWYEVVDTVPDGCSVEYRSDPDANIPMHTTFADVVIANNTKRPLEEQEKVHFLAACDMLAPKANRELRELSIACCRDFLARDVGVVSLSAEGLDGTKGQLLGVFLADEWPENHADEIDELFRMYIRAGHVPVSGKFSYVAKDGTAVQAHSPLEHAARKGRARVMAALTDAGADVLADNATRPLGEQQRAHATAITDMLSDKTTKELTELSIACCKDFLGRGVSASDMAYVLARGASASPLLHFVARNWREPYEHEIESVFRSHIRLCLTSPPEKRGEVRGSDDQTKVSSVLEQAVCRGNLLAMRALLEEGADFTAVPAEPLVLNSGVVAAGPGQFLEFVRNMNHLGVSVVDALYANAVEAVMHRQIAEHGLVSSSDAHSRKDSAPARSRRAGL